MSSLENFRLVVFRAVAGQLSFRKAAEELFLTQPAVSQQIKALEEELGTQLIDRAGRRVRLTVAGSVLLDHARQSSTLLEQARDEIAALDGSFGGQLALGASTTIAQYVLPGVLGAFCRMHPRVRAQLTSGNTEHIVEAVEEGRVALGFIEGPPRSNSVTVAPFLRDELVLIAPMARSWAKTKDLTVAGLAELPLLMREHGSGTRRIVELALERKGLRTGALRIAMELDATEAIKSAVEAGVGAGFVSRCAIVKDLRLGKSFRIVPVAGLRVERDLLLVAPCGAELRGVAQEFRRFLLEQVSERTRRVRKK
ncbi:LysR substrate-binding domain-containing protein [Telmatobacter bradus]|uniref:LysR substrate-binding domain-containing protein n=1 Tax=Telmatobacter bradus TaxID=474953 RepID=UPI003B43B508